MCDWIVVSHVVDLETLEADRVVEISNQSHILKLADHRITERLLQKIVIGLLDIPRVPCFELLALDSLILIDLLNRIVLLTSRSFTLLFRNGIVDL